MKKSRGKDKKPAVKRMISGVRVNVTAGGLAVSRTDRPTSNKTTVNARSEREAKTKLC